MESDIKSKITIFYADSSIRVIKVAGTWNNTTAFALANDIPKTCGIKYITVERI